jgi:hypothetical protein
MKKTRTPLPVVTIHKGEKCVEPTEIMRRDHMNFILHQRDETVHEGIRTTRHSLKKCINCHADPETNSVLGENGFCQSCHSYAAVSMDCFGCHTPLAEEDAEALANHPANHPLGNPDDKHLERILTSASFTPLNTRLQEPKP